MGDGTPHVWIDQDLCTGDGICVQIAPGLFTQDIDGLAYLRRPTDGLERRPGRGVDVPADLLEQVETVVRRCPGGCVHLRITASACRPD